MNGGVRVGLRVRPAPAAPGRERFVTKRRELPAGVSRCVIKVDNVQFQSERLSTLMTDSWTLAPCGGPLRRSLHERVNRHRVEVLEVLEVLGKAQVALSTPRPLPAFAR